jgi:mono/diheme cytochrome c family protein
MGSLMLRSERMRLFCFAAIVSLLLISFLTASAGTLTGSPTRSSPQDLEVFDIKADRSVSAPRYYRYEQLLTLPLITVKTAKDPNTQQPATYTGVYFNDLIQGLRSSPEQTVVGANCYDGYQQYYDLDYDEKHHPIFLLKYDGKAPADWPKSEHNSPMGPYCVVHENFRPLETVYGYTEEPRIPFGIVSVELTTYALSLGKFDAPDPHNSEVTKGQKIAVGSCVSCHNNGSAGGKMAQRPWQVLAAHAVYNSDYFRQYVVNPQKFKPNVAMPAHPTFDSATLDALQTYFKTVLPGD